MLIDFINGMRSKDLAHYAEHLLLQLDLMVSCALKWFPMECAIVVSDENSKKQMEMEHMTNTTCKWFIWDILPIEHNQEEEEEG